VSRTVLRGGVLALAVANLVAFLWLQRERAALHAPPAPLPPDVPPLRLLAEVQGKGEEGEGQACRLVESSGRERALALVRDASAAGLQAAVAREAERRVTGYWVYLPPFPDREAAREAVRRLAEGGVHDVQVLGGRRANAVSLGLFRNRALAERRRAQAAALGYEPVIEPRVRQAADRWWVELRGAAGPLAGFLLTRGLEGRTCPPGGRGSG